MSLIYLIACSKCGLTIGKYQDSIYGINECYVLSRSTGIINNKKKPLISTNGFDQFSVYSETSCMSCSAILGRYYLSTNHKLTRLFNQFIIYKGASQLIEISKMLKNETCLIDHFKEINSIDKQQHILKDIMITRYDPFKNKMRKKKDKSEEYLYGKI